MSRATKFDLINSACGQVRLAKTRARNNFCSLHDNPLHRQSAVLLLGLDLETLHEIRGILRDHPEGNEEVLALLECLRDTVFRNITNCIHAVTETVAQPETSLDTNARTRIKHDVEGALVKAADCVRRAFNAFGALE
jgi:hypothetical protein